MWANKYHQPYYLTVNNCQWCSSWGSVDSPGEVYLKSDTNSLLLNDLGQADLHFYDVCLSSSFAE